MPEKLTQERSTLAITRRGEPVLAVMTRQHYEAILEILEILGNVNLMNNLRQGLAEAKSGQGARLGIGQARLNKSFSDFIHYFPTGLLLKFNENN